MNEINEKYLDIGRKPYKYSDIFLSLIIYSSVILPSGSIFGLNVKILFVLFFLLIVDKRILYKLCVSLIPILVFMLLYVYYSFLIFKHDDTFIFSQAKDILTFFLIFYMGSKYCEMTKANNIFIFTIIKSVFIVGLIKALILLISYITGQNVSLIIFNLSRFFNVSIMSFDVADSYLSRINFTSDSIIGICIFYLIIKILKNKNVKFNDYIYFVFISFSCLITMSRFQWMAGLVSIILGIIVSFGKVRSVILSIFIIFFGSILISLNSVQEMISTRFDKRLVDSSDIERVIQGREIYSKFDDAVFFGNGLGYYVPNLVRTDLAKYSYELQIPALLMQIGIFGLIFIMFLILFPLYLSSRKMNILNFLCFFLIVFIWIYGAMFNPILFSSSAGICLLLLLLISKVDWIRGKY